MKPFEIVRADLMEGCANANPFAHGGKAGERYKYEKVVNE